MLLHAYFDESGTHQGAQALSVAGYVSTVEKWEAFEEEWQRSMAIYGIEFFHRTDFVSGQKQFKNWPKQKKAPRLRKLIDIVNHHALAAIGAVIPMNLYETLSKEDRAVCNSPYLVAVGQCCMEVSRWVKKAHPDAEVAYVFEAGATGTGAVHEFFSAVMRDSKAKQHLKIFSYMFGDKRQLVPLQAADILAYELYQNLPRVLGTNPLPPRRETYNRLRQAPFSTFKNPTLDNLQTVVKALTMMKLSWR